ncbi:unnamed protein product [Pylaiella littoralis]
MQATQFWKPGETKPRGGGKDGDEPGDARSGGSGQRSGKGDSNSSRGSTGRKRDSSREDHAERRNGSSSGSAKKKERKGKGKDAQQRSRVGGIDAEVSRSASKPPVSGPSQGLLAMKFMQRKVKAEEAQKQQQDKREKLEREFSSSYAKRLKADKSAKDRLICQEDELDPALVLLGRRSFGGFNTVAEAAYNACVRDIAAGERLGQPQRRANGGGDGGGISDTEMAETFSKNVRRIGRR